VGIYIRRLELTPEHDNDIDLIDTSALVAVLMKASNLRYARVEGLLAITALTVMSDTCTASLKVLYLMLPTSTIPTVLTYTSTFSHLEHLTLSIYPDNNTGPPEASDAAPWTMNRLQSLALLSSTSPPPLALIHFLADCSFPIIQRLDIDVDVTSKREARALSELLSRFALLRVTLTLMRTYHQYVLPHIRAATLFISDTPQSAQCLSQHIKDIHIKSPREYDEAFTFFRELCTTKTAVQQVYLDDWNVCANWFDPDEDAELVIEGAPHMMQLFHWAAVLWKRKGIRVYDSDTKLISDYFTDQAKNVALS
jgi:hypothetical protein